MAMTLKPGKDKRFTISTYLTQSNQEIKTKIIFISKRKVRHTDANNAINENEYVNGASIILNEKHTLKLANYLTDVLYQLGMINELDMISKKGKYLINDKSQNGGNKKEESGKNYKNPFKNS